jgi:hypothetical protein
MTWVVLGFFAFVGVGLLVLSVSQVLHVRQVLAHGQELGGEVHAIQMEPDSDGMHIYYPVVRFRTPEGVEREFRGTGASSDSYQVGEAVLVIYNPAQPDVPRLRNFGELWLWPVAFGAIGLLFAGVGLSALLFGRPPLG